MKKIIIAGNYGAGNMGDEMILEGLIKSIKSILSDAKINVLTSTPKETKEKYSVETNEKFPSGIRSLVRYLLTKNKTKKLFREADYFILGGGGLFGDLTFRAYLIWGIQAYMAYKYKKPVIMYGQSIGHLKCYAKKTIVKKLFEKAQFIAVRDRESKNELLKLRIKNKIIVMPDLAFRKTITPIEGCENKIVAVALRNSGGASGKNIKEFKKFFSWLKENGWEITAVNFQRNFDSHLHEKLFENSIEPNGTEEIYEIFKKSKIIIGMRLHSIISAIKTEKPFIAVNYSSKVKNLIRDTKISCPIIDFENITYENLKRNFIETMKREKQIKEEICNFKTKTAKDFLKTENLLRKILV